jgi:hypothetical protein
MITTAGGAAGFDRRTGFQVRVVVAAGIDRGRLDIRVLGIEALDQLAHFVGEVALNRNREEEVDFGWTSGPRRAGKRDGGRNGEGCTQCSAARDRLHRTPPLFDAGKKKGRNKAALEH